MYEAVIQEYNRKSGKLSVSELVSWLKKQFYKSASTIPRGRLYSLVHGWIKRGVSPYNEAKTPSKKWLVPSKALAYFIGATLGDGHLQKKGCKRVILFRVKDYEFALIYAKCYDSIEGKGRRRRIITEPRPSE